MPELPEVETFKRYLDGTSLNQRIINVEVRDSYVLKHVSARELARRLKGRQFGNTHRHGKHLFVRAADELWLRLHFGMTGSLDYLKPNQVAPVTARVIFRFVNNSRLAFDDQRKFGEIELLNNVEQFLQTRGIGPDALELNPAGFRAIFGKRRGAVKAILLNQQLIAGIGNLYADEILFHVRLHPATDAARLGDKHLSRLFRAMRHVLGKAIVLKTDFDRLPKSWLLTNRWKRGRCSRCDGALKSATIGGRTTWFCANCQKRI